MGYWNIIGVVLIIGWPLLICVVIPYLALRDLAKQNPPDPDMW